MITSRRTLGLLLATSFLVLEPFFQSPEALAATRSGNETQRSDHQVTVYSSGSSASRPAKSKSMVARAATGQWADSDPQLESPPLVADEVRTVGFNHPYGSSCGPVCDCGQCEAACGVEGVYAEDTGCGFEVGCGLGHALESVRSYPWGDGGCDAGCTDGCCESACGIEGAYVDGPACGMEAWGDCSCDACTGCQADHIPLCVPILRMNWHSFDFFWGHQGYTGPLNYVSTSNANPNLRSGSGSFGFYQGFNKGTSLKRWLGWDLASQFGARATQSDLSGGGFTQDRRYQVFVTGGVFRRVDYGLQYGLVMDYLNQDWYFQSNALQLRGEMSWRCDSCDTFGFQFMTGVRDENSGTVINDGAGNTIISTISLEPTDQYRLFYRRAMSRSGQFTAFAGWTNRDDAVLGSNFSLHLFPRVLLASDLAYLLPNEGRSSRGNEQESWNIAIGFVFRPGGPRASQSYHLPMFDVADNGTFMMDRR